MKTRKAAMILVAIIMMFVFVSNAHADVRVYKTGYGVKYGSGNTKEVYVRGINENRSQQSDASIDRPAPVEGTQQNEPSKMTSTTRISGNCQTTHTWSLRIDGRLVDSGRIRVYGAHTFKKVWSH